MKKEDLEFHKKHIVEELSRSELEERYLELYEKYEDLKEDFDFYRNVVEKFTTNKNISLIDFTANDARKFLESTYTDNLLDILREIKTSVESGCENLSIYKPLKENTKKELINRGFKVDTAPSLATIKENLHYYISWKK